MPSKDRVSLVRTPLPGPRPKQLIQKEIALMAGGAYGSPSDRRFIGVKASGSLVEDADGNRFIDFGSGWGTNNVGNCQPEVVEAVNSTMRQLGVTCWTSAGNTAQRFDLAEKLLQVCPKRTDRVLFLTTGTEAVEAALRVMRRATGRPFVISFYGQYHGLSYGCMAAGPLQANVREGGAPPRNGSVH